MTTHSTELVRRIDELKRDRNALILAHNYQRPEVQDIADFTGDSLELSRIAQRATQDVIVFCGVRFMAETAAMLCPEKRVLLPVLEAGCALADTAQHVDPVEKTRCSIFIRAPAPIPSAHRAATFAAAGVRTGSSPSRPANNT